MNKLRSFVRLDFVTIKPYLGVKYLFVFAGTTVFLIISSKSVIGTIGVAAMISTMYMSYPFVLSEKSNMDALYATLAVDRKTVVRGRYLFALLLDVCSVLIAFVLSIALEALKKAGVLGPDAVGQWDSGGVLLGVVAVMVMIFIFIQSVQLPVFFKLGYSKAKIFSMVPYLFLMVTYFGFAGMANAGGGLPEPVAAALAGGLWIPAVAAALLAIVFVSYRLSLAFYKKREF